MRRSARLAVLALGIGLLPLSCGKKADPVQETIDRIVKAAEKRDSDAALENLSSEFRDAQGGGLAEAQSTLRRYLAAYESLDITIADSSIERAPNAARVTFRADLQGKPRQIGGLDGILPRSASYRFELRLVPEGDLWKIAWASWEPVQDR